jgi:hypothetical protein
MTRRTPNSLPSAALEAYLARSETATAFRATMLDKNTVPTAPTLKR